MVCERVIVGEASEFPLNGMLTLPEDCTAPVPALVMVHGSGASNMDEKVMKLTPFKDLAEGLAAHGIATLRYDKRSFAHGRKLLKRYGSELTVKEEVIDDALLAVQMLKSDPRVDPRRVHVLGHSMGAMLAPRIDAEGAGARGLIMMAGTPYRLEDIVLRQLKQGGASASPLRLIARLEDRIFSGKFDGLYDLDDETAKRKRFAGGTTLYYFKEMGRRTAADYLLESDKPVLIMQGGKDFQVLAQDDFAQFQRLLVGRENTSYKLYPELNHCFVEGLYDDILKASKEYGTERHIGERVIADIAAFVHGCA